MPGVGARWQRGEGMAEGGGEGWCVLALKLIFLCAFSLLNPFCTNLFTLAAFSAKRINQISK